MLPSELWFNVFDRLTPAEFCKTVPRACREWRALAHELRGPCVTVKTLDDVEHLRRLRRIHVVHLRTCSFNAELQEIKRVKDANSVLLEPFWANVRCLALKDTIRVPDAVHEAFAKWDLSVLGGGAVRLEYPYMYPFAMAPQFGSRASGTVNLSRTGDLMLSPFRIDLPGLPPAPSAPPRRVPRRDKNRERLLERLRRKLDERRR